MIACGIVQKPGIFLNDPKSRYRFFTLVVSSGGELPVDKKCDFSSFLWVWKHPWSRVNRCRLLFSFPFITFHVAFISSHVPVILISCLSCSVAIKDTGLRKLCSNRSGDVRCVSAQTFYALFFHIMSSSRCCYRLAIVFEACAGCHLQASWKCELAVLRCKPS